MTGITDHITDYPQTPGGHPVQFATRLETNDEALVNGILGGDEYGLASLEPLTGWIIDIGAHIGIVAVSLALDHPDTRVIAVEAIPDNATMIEFNAKLNGLADRITVISAGAGAPGQKVVPITYGYTWVGVSGSEHPEVPTGYVTDCRYIGNIFNYPEGEQEAITEDRPGISLGAILRRYKIKRVSLLKIDCEGCEWAFLTDPAIAKVDRIIGEYHGSGTTTPTGMERVHALLDATHEVTWRRGEDVGLFEAVVR